MDIIKLDNVTKCDMPLCRNAATIAIGGEGVMPRRRLNMCVACAAELAQLLNSQITPKSPQNHIRTAYESQTNAKKYLGGNSYVR